MSIACAGFVTEALFSSLHDGRALAHAISTCVGQVDTSKYLPKAHTHERETLGQQRHTSRTRQFAPRIQSQAFQATFKMRCYTQTGWWRAQSGCRLGHAPRQTNPKLLRRKNRTMPSVHPDSNPRRHSSAGHRSKLPSAKASTQRLTHTVVVQKGAAALCQLLLLGHPHRPQSMMLLASDEDENVGRGLQRPSRSAGGGHKSVREP